MRNPGKKPLPRTVGIMGAGDGCGVTHFALLLANYLAAVELEKTAVFEWKPKNDLEKLVNIYTGGRPKKAPVSILDVDYFFHGDAEEFNTCIQHGYGTVLLDLGTVKDGRQPEFLQCQRQYFLFALNEWKMQDVIDQKNLWKKGRGQWEFFMVFGSREARREICRRYGLRVMQIPFAPDAFSIGQDMANFLGRIWNQGK